MMKGTAAIKRTTTSPKNVRSCKRIMATYGQSLEETCVRESSANAGNWER
jgi:hypothetical protein